MELLFNQFHPKNKLRPGRGVTVHFYSLLKDNFPTYDTRVLKLAVRLLTIFRIRTWNKLAQQKKKGQKIEDMKLAPIKKLVPLTKEEKVKRVGKKRQSDKKSVPITRRGKIVTAEFSSKK